ncbi:MAG: type IV pilus assembly protein PilM [Candidatus Saccharibacteria bacterium]|nr:type IV pilus assembly protein PilM [Candidatus Saccharibacteria bacterium]
MKYTYFFRDKPLFGLDIGIGTAQAMQIEEHDGKRTILGYGSCTFDPDAIKEGVLVDVPEVARAVKQMLKSGIKGDISTSRVALTIPSARTFSRAIRLPHLEEKEVSDAVQLEAEQYIPVAIDSLYLDYTQLYETPEYVELFAVAAPKQIVDSYLELAQSLDIEPVIIETSVDASTRLINGKDHFTSPTVLIDFGKSSADITMYDGNIIATGTVGGGGDNFTSNISSQLGVTPEEARLIKTKFGLNYSIKQNEISMALEPILDQLFLEIKRMIRYYDDRYTQKQGITQIVIMGLGADLPGLADRMTNTLRIPVRTSDPWQIVKYQTGLEPIREAQRAQFMTVAGLALVPPKGVFL